MNRYAGLVKKPVIFLILKIAIQINMSMPSLFLLVIRCFDIEKTKLFYEIIGLKFKQEKHGNGPIHYSCDLGDVIFEIYPVKPPELPTRNRLGFLVDNLTEVVLRLEHNNVILTNLGFKNAFTAITDPDGRTVDLMQKP